MKKDPKFGPSTSLCSLFLKRVWCRPDDFTFPSSFSAQVEPTQFAKCRSIINMAGKCHHRQSKLWCMFPLFWCLSCSSWESAGKQWLMAGRACGLPGPTAHRPLIWLLSLWNWGIGRNEKSEKRAKERIKNHGTLSLCGSDATSADLRRPPLRVGDEEELRRALLCLYALKLPWIRDIGVHSVFSFKFLMQRNATERTTLAWTRHDCVSMFIKISKTFFDFFFWKCIIIENIDFMMHHLYHLGL